MVFRCLMACVVVAWVGLPSFASEPPVTPVEAPVAVAVAPLRVHPLLKSVEPGLREWLRQEIARSGRPVVDRGEAERAAGARVSPDKPFLHGADAVPIGAATRAAVVVFGELKYDAGRTQVRIRAWNAHDASLLASGEGDALLGAVGEALSAAAAPVVDALSRAPSQIRPPRLAEFGTYSRALSAFTEGDLPAAWKALVELDTTTATGLRAEFEAASESPDTPVPMRSRMASARGVSDPDWLKVRQGLRERTDPAMLVAGADAAAAREDPEAALRLYREAAELAPTDVDAAMGEARMLTELERSEEAGQAYVRVTQLAPAEPEAVHALAANATVPETTRAEHALTSGQIHERQLDAEAAKRAYQKATQGGPAGILAQARANVAALNARMGNNGEALLGYEELNAGGSQDPDVLMGLALARGEAGDDEGAEEALGRLVEREPGNAAAHTALGRVLAKKGDTQVALTHLERAVQLAPDDPVARKELARAYRKAGDPDAALTALDPSSVPAEHRVGLLREAAEAHTEAGRPDEARLVLEEAVQIEPDDPPLRTALATAYDANGQSDKAAGEREAVAGLTGERIAPTQHDEVAEGFDGKTIRGVDFGPLVSTFPLKHPDKRRRSIEAVAWLGLSEERDVLAHVRAWLLPKHIDLAALDEAIRESLETRYEVVGAEHMPEIAERSLENVRAMSTKVGDIGLVNESLAVDALLVAQVRPTEPVAIESPIALPLEIEVRMAGGTTSDDVFILANKVRLPNPGAFVRWNVRAALPYTALLILMILPVIRGWGTVLVKLDFQTEKGTKGFFSVQLSRKPGKAKREKTKSGGGKTKAQRYQRRMRAWSRFAAHMVGRETRFRMVPARTWYVAVHGLLQDAKSKEVIGNYLEERKVTLERGQTLEVGFDFRAKEAAIEVRLFRPEGQEDAQVLVALAGDPESIRYVRDETVVLHVGNGPHVVLAGHADRVLEREVTITEFGAQSLGFELANDAAALFTGCPDAVEPYVTGDAPAASRALERAGLSEIANAVRARYHEERGEQAEAARFYEAAGQLTAAAELTADAAGDSAEPDRSATLFEKAGDFHRAADRYAESGEGLKAAQAYEAAYDYENAIDAYRAAGEWSKTMELLEKTGGYFEAATIALGQGDPARAIRNLQLVDLRDPDYAETCKLLAEIFAQREEWGLAIDKAREGIEASGGEESAPLEQQEQLAVLLEKAGRADEALSVYEGIRKRDFDFGEVGTRIEALRSQVASEETRAEVEGAATAPEAAATEDRYEILGELGRGGMGIVYKARDRRLGRVVALKRLPDNLRDHPTAVQLFLREARAAAALNHPNIVTLFDADQADGNYFITMEMLEGFPLDQILKKRGKLSPKDALRLAVQISTGLQYAHERGIVHRDVKTANLFFTRERVVKVMDFGLAKMMEEVRRAATVIGGTPYYMAPEQAAGERVDHRADLYAFGVTLFELVTGRVPFTEGDVTYQHRHEAPPDPREFAPDLPEPLATCILRLMAKAPDDRAATTAEVTAALESLARSV